MEIKRSLLEETEFDKKALENLKNVVWKSLENITTEPENGCPQKDGYHCGKWEEGFWYAGTFS